MKDIAFDVHSHVEVTRWGRAKEDKGFTLRASTDWQFAPASSTAIRRSPGKLVRSFRELAYHVAQLSAANPRLYPLYRGQHLDFLNRAGGSMLYPTILRLPVGKSRLTRSRIVQRFEHLKRVVRHLRQRVTVSRWQTPLSAHTEYWWSLIQHYELARTPLLDLTQSLRVACTFALSHRDAWGAANSGFVFVLGLPNAPACLAPMVDEEMVVVRLQSVCPPDALRPHLQDGYLVGRWPLSGEKLKGDNAAYRMIGKYRLDNSAGKFWSDGFEAIPYSAIYPPDDSFGEHLRTVAAELISAASE